MRTLEPADGWTTTYNYLFLVHKRKMFKFGSVCPALLKSETSSSLQKVLWWNRAHGWCLFGGICFFNCRKSGRRAFCGGVSQVPRITIRQMKMNRFGPFRTERATGGRSNESQRMSHQTSFFPVLTPNSKGHIESKSIKTQISCQKITTAT